MPLSLRPSALAVNNLTHVERRLTSLTSVAVTAVALTLAFIFGVGLALGRGRINVFTHTPLAEDLLSLHAAGAILRGNSTALYDDATAQALQAAALGPVGREVYNRYLSAPHTAWLFSPLATLPFPLVAALWSGLSLFALFVVPRLCGLEQRTRFVVAAFAFVPVWDGLAAGQNSLFTLVLFATSFWAWRNGRGVWAGLALGAVATYKPHLVLGPALLFLLEAGRDPRPLLALLVVGGMLLGIDLLGFAEQSRAFAAWGWAVVAGRAPVWASLRPGGELTVTAFWALLLPRAVGLAHALALLSAGVATVGFVLLYLRMRGAVAQPRSAQVERTLFAAATLLTLWLTPHAHLHEWTLLLLPAGLRWCNHRRAPQHLALACGAVALLAPACIVLARAQLHQWGAALHLGVPLLVFATWVLLRGSWSTHQDHEDVGDWAPKGQRGAVSGDPVQPGPVRG